MTRWRTGGLVLALMVAATLALTPLASSAERCAGRTPTMVGTPDADTLIGTPRADVILAGAGDDTIVARGGDDVVCGGDGADTIYGAGGDDLLLGHAGDDTLVGGGGNDRIRGAAGDDTLIGGPGDDVLRGGVGDDTLEGRDGADLVRGGGGRDLVDGGDGDDIVAGGRDADRLIGGQGDDTLAGGRGDDVVMARPGVDTADGGAGSDVCNAATTTRCEAPPRVCPVQGRHVFVNSWHDPRVPHPDRPGGRHLGIDLAAATGTPLVAIEAGWIEEIRFGEFLRGTVTWMVGESGWRYEYAHQSRVVSGLRAGDRVELGETIGWVGSTGASRAPHLHFQAWPYGHPWYDPVNPYAMLVGVCR